MERKSIGLLTAGHIITDINQGALPAILPFLIASHNLSYASAAFLVFASNASSSIIQPLFGHFADRISAPWIMPLGIFLAGLGIAVTGIAPSYLVLFLSVSICGIGVAAFHPEAARMVHAVSSEKKATGFSMFSAGGSIGFAIGPVFATAALSLYGLQGSLILIIPVTIMALIIMTQFRTTGARQKTYDIKESSHTVELVKDEWNPFFRLLGCIICRSIIFSGLNTFLPLYWINTLGQSKQAGSAALTILLISGAIGTIIVGRLADRYGHIITVRTGFIVLIPILIIFTRIQNVSIATAMLVPIGFALFSPFSPMVVLGQKYLPNHLGLASGITLGFAVSIGGAFAPLLGWIADNYGIVTTLTCISFIPIIAALLSFILTTPKVDLLSKISEQNSDNSQKVVG